MENISLIHFRMTFKRVGKEAMHPELEETPVFVFNLQNYIIFMNHEPILLSTGLVIGMMIGTCCSSTFFPLSAMNPNLID